MFIRHFDDTFPLLTLSKRVLMSTEEFLLGRGNALVSSQKLGVQKAGHLVELRIQAASPSYDQSCIGSAAILNNHIAKATQQWHRNVLICLHDDPRQLLQHRMQKKAQSP